MTPARRTTPARGRGAPSATAEVREALMTVGCRLLSSDGPAALSARRLAAEVGTSTMAIYTHFGGVPDLVEAIVQMGLDRLAGWRRSARPTIRSPIWPASPGRTETAHWPTPICTPSCWAASRKPTSA